MLARCSLFVVRCLCGSEADAICDRRIHDNGLRATNDELPPPFALGLKTRHNTHLLMKFVSDVRLLLLSIWLGAAVFFIGVAASAFAILPQRELAGAVVSRTLLILNFGGMGIAALLILTSFVGTRSVNRIAVWVERFLLLVLAAACAVGQFVIGFWLAMLRNQMGKPIDEVAVDDPLRIQFMNLHEWSVWVLSAGMIASLIAFFIIANRKFGTGIVKPFSSSTTTNDPFDFSKEFRKS